MTRRRSASFVWLNPLSLIFTLGAIVIGILFIVCVGVVPAVLAFAGLSGWEEIARSPCSAGRS